MPESTPASAPVPPDATAAELLSAGTHLERLGFRPDDAADTRELLRRVAADEVVLARVATLAATVREGIGVLDRDWSDPFADVGTADTDAGLPTGATAIATLLSCVEDVRAAYARRGVAEELAWHCLSDLGQQVWVHRQTDGAFGLHTQGWVAHTSFRANLFWLGRLQFNLMPADPDHAPDDAPAGRAGGWWLSTHIPQSGPLDPGAVQDSFTRALAFVAEHFPELSVVAFHCDSWLLDEQLVDAVPGSNIASFQQRWSLFGEPSDADASIVFFVFRRRGEVDRSTLPRRSTLERAVLDRFDAGGHWYGRQGLVTDLGPFRVATP